MASSVAPILYIWKTQEVYLRRWQLPMYGCTGSAWSVVIIALQVAGVAAMHVMPCYNDDADDTQNTQSRKLRLVGWGRGGGRVANNVLNSKRSLKLEFSTFCLFPWLVKWQHHCGVTTAVAAPAFLLLINAVVLIATHSFTPSVLHLRVAYLLVWLSVVASVQFVCLSFWVWVWQHLMIAKHNQTYMYDDVWYVKLLLTGQNHHQSPSRSWRTLPPWVLYYIYVYRYVFTYL